MRHKHGFTLIEVIGATAAFVIAFLAGTAAFTRLLHHEIANYHRAQAGIAAIRWASGDLSMTGLSPDLVRKDDPLPANSNPTYYTAYYYRDPATDPGAVFLGRYHKHGTPP